jgi:hypothetical protein
VSEVAGELIGEVAGAMKRGDGLAALGAGLRPYPTRSAILGRVVDQWRRTRLTPTAKRLFAAFFRATT